MTDTPLLPILLRGWDDGWERLDRRLAGLTDDEYLWEPAPDAWTVRQAGADGWTVDRVIPDPEPAPVTTIAWRTWHLASDCFADYLADWPGRPLEVTDRQWHGDAATALRDLRRAAAAFRDAAVAKGEDGIRQQLGPAWGPSAEGTWADLVVHAFDELAHHGAEIALLRDLYRATGVDRG